MWCPLGSTQSSWTRRLDAPAEYWDALLLLAAYSNRTDASAGTNRNENLHRQLARYGGLQGMRNYNEMTCFTDLSLRIYTQSVSHVIYSPAETVVEADPQEPEAVVIRRRHKKRIWENVPTDLLMSMESLCLCSQSEGAFLSEAQGLLDYRWPPTHYNALRQRRFQLHLAPRTALSGEEQERIKDALMELAGPNGGELRG
jgi:hypothetical protein